MQCEPRPEILQIQDVVHGAPDVAELAALGLTPDDILDFSVNGNPYGAAPGIRQAIARVSIERFPDRDARAFRQALAKHLDCPPEHIVAGNGSAELLWLVALAFLRPGDRTLIIGPTFGEYERAARLMGAELHVWTAQPQEHFRLHPDRILQTLQAITPRLVFLCNPNNPTGSWLDIDLLGNWSRALPQTLFVVDEAYLPFAPDAPSALTLQGANLLVMHSMTKAHALAGLRLGYAVGHPRIIQALALTRPPWNVNALAQAAGIAALQDPSHLRHSLAQLVQAKTVLIQGLQALGCAPVPSATHFFLLPVGNAKRLRQALLQQGILVRDCTSFGLPAYMRVATRRPEENARFLTALNKVRSSCDSS